MKKYILMALVLTLQLVIYACSFDEEVRRSDRYDFRNVHWGATSEKVKESETEDPTDVQANVITYSGELDGMPAIVGYLFEEDKLVRAGYVITEAHEEPSSYVQGFNKLRDFYTSTYGRPAYDIVDVEGDTQENIRTDAFAEAACEGRAQYLAGWGTDGSMIRLKLHGRDGSCELGVMYESKHFYVAPELKERELERYRSNMKRGGAEEL